MASLLISLVSWPCFYYKALVAVLVAGMIVNLDISSAELMALEIIIGLS